MARGLTLHFQGIDEFVTVTGQVFRAPSYTMLMNWFGQQLEVPISVSTEVREALLGSQMLEDCRLTIDYAERTVKIERSA